MFCCPSEQKCIYLYVLFFVPACLCKSENGLSFSLNVSGNGMNEIPVHDSLHVTFLQQSTFSELYLPVNVDVMSRLGNQESFLVVTIPI